MSKRNILNEMKNKRLRIAVTGATGFIGQYVLAELLKYPVDVIAITREGVPTNLTQNKHLEIVQLDLQEASIDAFDKIGCPGVLIHLAWGGLPNYKSLHHFEYELPMQYQFLQSLVMSGLSSMFVAGTCFEYGMQSGQLDEGMQVQPNNPYGFAKNALYCQLQYLQAIKPFSLTWGRLFYLYGNGQSENSLQPQLLKSVKQNETVFNMSGGEQLRDYLSISKVAEHIVALALHRENIGIVNICSGKPISVRKQVEDWITENNWQIELNLGHYPYPDYEPMAFWGDRNKLNNYIGLK